MIIGADSSEMVRNHNKQWTCALLGWTDFDMIELGQAASYVSTFGYHCNLA
jgi:hypothetical protein